MTGNADAVRVLDEQECWGVLAGHHLGRLAVALNNEPEIYPVNFVVDGRSIVFRTAEGSKLVLLTVNEKVAFEVDAWDATGALSVVCRGRAREVTDHDQLTHLKTLPLTPWVATRKSRWVRIEVSTITGRSFTFGPEPTEEVDDYR